jgi:hypothetical protein
MGDALQELKLPTTFELLIYIHFLSQNNNTAEKSAVLLFFMGSAKRF